MGESGSDFVEKCAVLPILLGDVSAVAVFLDSREEMHDLLLLVPILLSDGKMVFGRNIALSHCVLRDAQCHFVAMQSKMRPLAAVCGCEDLKEPLCRAVDCEEFHTRDFSCIECGNDTAHIVGDVCFCVLNQRRFSSVVKKFQVFAYCIDLSVNVKKVEILFEFAIIAAPHSMVSVPRTWLRHFGVGFSIEIFEK